MKLKGPRAHATTLTGYDEERAAKIIAQAEENAKKYGVLTPAHPNALEVRTKQVFSGESKTELLRNAEASMLHAALTGRISVAIYRKWLRETERKLAERR